MSDDEAQDIDIDLQDKPIVDDEESELAPEHESLDAMADEELAEDEEDSFDDKDNF